MSDVISETTQAETKQFDFLEGEWSAICRFPLPDGSWGEGPGLLTASKVLDGCVSLEFFEGPIRERSSRASVSAPSIRKPRNGNIRGRTLLRRVASWSGADDLKATPSIFTASGKMRLGATFSRGSIGLGLPSGLRTGRVTAP